jgi:hypothetical protein
MKRTLIVIILGGLLDWYGPAAAQPFEDLHQLWGRALAVVHGGAAVTGEARLEARDLSPLARAEVTAGR